MPSSCTLVFPNQLFHSHPALDRSRPVFIIEDSLFFGDIHYPCHFHLQKILYHRLTILRYQERLIEEGYQSTILPYSPQKTIVETLESLHKKGFTKIYCVEAEDFLLNKRLRNVCTKKNISLHLFPSPLFLTTPEIADSFFNDEKGYLMAKFYIFQRKRLKILVDPSGKPTGGQWSFDEENRKKLPSSVHVPKVSFLKLSEADQLTLERTQKEFPKAVGVSSQSRPPCTHLEATVALNEFLKVRFENFGLYEDAISREHSLLFHSYLTPALNIGLITPDDVIQKTLRFAEVNRIPLNSLEGFVRQIIGWREFIRHLYRREGVRMRNLNFFNHHRPIPPSFYNATTGIPIIDHTIQKLHQSAYCHHIERLMVLGNFMLLCEFDPHEVYRWFMEFFIDSYDWVMVPNVYGMSQFADGGIFATKPYISSSNYILKMSDEKKGDWQKIWDGLFWRFIHLHRDFFGSNFRLSMMVRQLEKMAPEKRESHLLHAEHFLKNQCRA